jgi:hypothetical protein
MTGEFNRLQLVNGKLKIVNVNIKLRLSAKALEDYQNLLSSHQLTPKVPDITYEYGHSSLRLKVDFLTLLAL